MGWVKDVFRHFGSRRSITPVSPLRSNPETKGFTHKQVRLGAITNDSWQRQRARALMSRRSQIRDGFIRAGGFLPGGRWISSYMRGLNARINAEAKAEAAIRRATA